MPPSDADINHGQNNNQKHGKGLGMGLIKKALALNSANIEVRAGHDIVARQYGEVYANNEFRLIFRKDDV